MPIIHFQNGQAEYQSPQVQEYYPVAALPAEARGMLD